MGLHGVWVDRHFWSAPQTLKVSFIGRSASKPVGESPPTGDTPEETGGVSVVPQYALTQGTSGAFALSARNVYHI